MNSILVFSLIVAGIILAVILIINMVYRNSVVSIIGISFLMEIAAVAILAYSLGILGLIHILWAAPVAIIIFFACLYYLNIKFKKPIGQLTVDIVEKLSKGELNFSFDKKIVERKDELGKISQALDEMKLQLNTIITKTQVICENISVSAGQQSASATQIFHGASQQASSTEEISSSMEEMASSIRQNSENAIETEAIFTKTKSEIERLRVSAKKSEGAIKEIAQKISIINEIAFQTNILALNAAVEAARAGEYGKGFAVVAAEVRKLAEHSKIAADEINTLAGTCVNLTIEEGRMMEHIVPEINKTLKMVQDITKSSKQQDSGSEQINNSVQLLNQVTQENATASEEMATSAGELTSQTEELKEMISFFNVDDIKKPQPTHQRKSKSPFISANIIKDNAEINLPVKNNNKAKILMYSPSDEGFERY
jgi:methyl-accepting chemotaxis protein